MASVQAAGAASHPYTCNTCQVAYRNIDLQKGHMKSDWHRYNLKRRVASLPPISADVFTEKVLQARAVSTAEADKAYFERACDICEKTYYSENAFQNHLTSQKHKAKQASSGQPTSGRADDETTSVVSSTFSLGEPIAPSQGEVDSDAEEEFSHVVEGLQKASITEQRPSPVKRPSHPQPAVEGDAQEDAAATRESDSATPVPAAQEPNWTLESCHCKIPYETEREQLRIGDFYDFRSTYSDDEEMSDDGSVANEGNGGAKLGARRSAKLTRMDGADMDGEGADGWETDSSASSLDSEDLTAVPAEGHIHQFERLDKHPHHSSQDPRQRHQADGWHSHAHKPTRAVFYDDYELHLPTGKSVGHRSLNKYFRQNLHNHPSAEERAERLAIEEANGDQEESTSDGQLVQTGPRSREMVPRGMAGMAGAPEQQKRRARRAEERGRTLEQVHSKQKDLAYGKKFNNHKNYYYREQGGG
ncbi:C2H2 type zinc-finger-domain-containing protein [Fusarium acuminatum]|uniref:C2H2 type zinc-finger-domain-containing protein n=1 Tax=Fusarium acuminatum TaxID=5515 RepID=A0ABZ2WN88_9HYPO